MYVCGAHRDGWFSKEVLRKQKGQEGEGKGKEENKREEEEKYMWLLQSPKFP